MAKKRVFEIAKEIKARGIELDSKELLNELRALDFAVATHSSSLDEDQATVAIEKIVHKHRPQAAAPQVKAAGFVVRRRRPQDRPAPASELLPPAVRPPMVRRAPPVEAAPVAAVPPAVRPAPASAPTMPVAEAGKVEERVRIAETVSAPESAQPQPPPAAIQAPPVEVPARAPAAPAVPRQAPEPARSAPLEPKREVIVSGESARGVRPPPRPSGAQPQPAAVDPRSLRPTATQAVVISRPLIPIRRVTPPADAHKRIPQAPGATGLRRPAPASTGGREFPEAPPPRELPAKKRGHNARAGLRENLSKQELVDRVHGGRALPLRSGKKRKAIKKGVKTQIKQMAAEKKVIKIDESITVAELSQSLGVKATELMRKLIAMGVMVTINSPLDFDTTSIMAGEYGWRVEKKGFEIENYISDRENAPEDLVSRPPVVTIMGHVDHGKTSLLDAIRNARVAAGEAGGITQHIGAYSVSTADGKQVTFLDTPGHEAFTAMRARGAKVTDLVVIVVAADDGVMPQTREAINHAKAAEVPILVAINKIDKPGANPQHVKNQLMEFGLVDESLGGETIMVPVSAKTKVGIDTLLEMILLQSEVLDLKANPERQAKGTVVESKLDKGRGVVATVIVSEGTLHTGDAVVSGTQHGKVRAMLNDRGEKVDTVLPGFPVEIIGLAGVPTAGDEFNVVEDDAAAKEIAEHRQIKEREKELTKSAKVRLEDLFAKASQDEVKELKLIVKADVQGSAEAVSAALSKLSTQKVTVNVIHSGVGGINGNDVMLASASDALIVGFNVRPEPKAAEVAQQQGIDIRLYSIIYEAVDEVQKAMLGLLEPTRREKALGRAEVRNTFNVPKIGTIAGCFVVDGKVSRSAQVRLLRDSKVVYTGKIGSLRRFKDDVREVEKGYECGLSIENFSDVKQGDVVEAFEIEEIRPSLT